MAMPFALGSPILAVLLLGAVDVTGVQADRQRLSAIAEAAALAGARDLSLASQSSVPEQRAIAFAQVEIAAWNGGPAVQVGAEVTTAPAGERVIDVRLDANKPSLFGRLLPPGGWRFTAKARAVSVNHTPLCVLVFGKDKPDLVKIDDESVVSAANCLVHSNGGISVEGDARVSAAQVQAVGAARGAIAPEPITDAPLIADPFAAVDFGSADTCKKATGSKGAGPLIYQTGVHTLDAGDHCDEVTVQGDAKLTLGPGVHVFRDSKLTAKENATLVGEDVVLLFTKYGAFEFTDDSEVSLEGRRTGAFAGFVMAAYPDNKEDFIISSDHVDMLLGVIYVPAATLLVQGASEIAEASDWTVVVAEALQMNGNPELVIQSNYRGSSVPVPSGVGPSTESTGARLMEFD